MQSGELEHLAERVEKMVEDLKAARLKANDLLSEKTKLAERIASLEKQLRQTHKEGDQVSDLSAQNKAYRKKNALLRTKVVSMLAKVESLQ